MVDWGSCGRPKFSTVFNKSHPPLPQFPGATIPWGRGKERADAMGYTIAWRLIPSSRGRCAGRRPYFQGLGLEELGIAMTERNQIKVRVCSWWGRVEPGKRGAVLRASTILLHVQPMHACAPRAG